MKNNDVMCNTVHKSNSMIQNGRFDLSLQEQKIMLYIISQISPQDIDFELLEFSIPEFCKACGIDCDNGKNYADLKKAVKHIRDKSWWIVLPDGRHTTVSWIEKPYINPKSGTISIKLDDDLKPYLLQLQANYTQYDLIYTLSFQSKYAIRLYEYIRSIHYNDLQTYTYPREISLDELRDYLGVNEYDNDGNIISQKYTTWQHFRDRALTPAIAEINTYSDKTITYTTSKQGQKVTGITITVKTKSINERNKADKRIKERRSKKGRIKNAS